MAYKIITPNEGNLITLLNIKEYLRIDTNDEDNSLQSMLDTAYLLAENLTHRTLLNTTFMTYRNSWNEEQYRSPKISFKIRKNPLQSVSFIKYYDSNNVLQTLNSSYYYITDEPNGYSKIIFTNSLPSLSDREQAIQIQFVAGYGTSLINTAPKDIIMAMRQHVAMLFENRGDYSVASQEAKNFLPETSMLIYRKYRIIELGVWQ